MFKFTEKHGHGHQFHISMNITDQKKVGKEDKRI